MQLAVGNYPMDCVMFYWVDAHLAGSLKGSDSTTGGISMSISPQTFVPLAWLFKMQGGCFLQYN